MDKGALTDDGKDVAESRHVWSGSAIRALQEAYREARSALAEVTKERDGLMGDLHKTAEILAARESELAECRKDAEVWRHIAQERYADYRRACNPAETGYAIEGALDALFRGYRRGGKHHQVFCSQCGGAFGPNYHGYSHCWDHAGQQSGGKA